MLIELYISLFLLCIDYLDVLCIIGRPNVSQIQEDLHIEINPSLEGQTVLLADSGVACFVVAEVDVRGYAPEDPAGARFAGGPI